MSSTRATSAAGATVIARRRSLLSAEILKVTSTKMWLGMLIGVALYIGIGVVATIFAPEQPGMPMPRLSTTEGLRNLFSTAGSGYVFAIVIGALGMTQELRHRTLSSMLLSEPRRNRVMVAKMGAYAGVGAFYGLVGVVFGYALALAFLPAAGALSVDARDGVLAVAAASVGSADGGTERGVGRYLGSEARG